MNPIEDTADVGVIIGRFQVHDLHDGHKDLLASVTARHDKVIVIVGTSPVLVSKTNPLDFRTRFEMLRAYSPDLVIAALDDQPTNEGWSNGVDCIIASNTVNNSVLIYGSRDAFIPYYTGKHKTVELAPSKRISGTDVRRRLALGIGKTSEFRHGVIYAAHNKYPTSYQTVDIAVVAQGQVLLGSKHTDPKNRLRFPGGFVDPTDESLEAAAKRELTEEVGLIETSNARYIGSRRIDDWRYRTEEDKILTSLIVFDYNYGRPVAGDDLDDVIWVDLRQAEKLLLDGHKPLLAMLKEHLHPTKGAAL